MTDSKEPLNEASGILPLTLKADKTQILSVLLRLTRLMNSDLHDSIFILEETCS